MDDFSGRQAPEILYDTIEKAIKMKVIEYEMTAAEVVGVLEMVKMNLISEATEAAEDDD